MVNFKKGLSILIVLSLSAFYSCQPEIMDETNNYELKKGGSYKKGECKCPSTGEVYSWFCGNGTAEMCLEPRPCPPLPPGCGLFSSSMGD